MKLKSVLGCAVFTLAICLGAVISAEEIIIFDDELHFGNLFDEERDGNMTAFEVRQTDPQAGQAHLRGISMPVNGPGSTASS